MKQEITITAKPRPARGKNEARRLRVQGLTPAVVYGAGSASVAVAVNPREVAKILHSASGHNTIFNLALEGSSTPVMIVDYQNDPVRDTLLHLDLKRIDLTKSIVVKIPIVVAGEPKGVKLQGGLLEVIKREIEIECLPNEIPELFNVDVSELMIGQNVRAGAIPLTESQKLMSSPDQVIAHVIALKAEEEAATPAAEAGAAPATTAEPEVIKKGKKDEEAPAAEEKKKK